MVWGRNGRMRATVAPFGIRICPSSLAVLTPLLRQNLNPLLLQNLTPLLVKIEPTHVQNFVRIAFTCVGSVFGICNGVSNKIYPNFVKIWPQSSSLFRAERVKFWVTAASSFQQPLLRETRANWGPGLGSGGGCLEARSGCHVLIIFSFLNFKKI